MLPEYSGLIAVLELFAERELFNAEIRVYGDSQLVIQQMFGTWRIKKGLYIPFAYRARELLSQFTNIQGEWIQRDRNHVADRLSKAALRRAGVELRLQPLEVQDEAGFRDACLSTRKPATSIRRAPAGLIEAFRGDEMTAAGQWTDDSGQSGQWAAVQLSRRLH
jgi:hypothetical protein